MEALSWQWWVRTTSLLQAIDDLEFSFRMLALISVEYIKYVTRSTSAFSALRLMPKPSMANSSPLVYISSYLFLFLFFLCLLIFRTIMKFRYQRLVFRHNCIRFERRGI
ncbi:hypothetical protein KSP39_PZI002029 [Platanthera zijinensis]|uniref:Uncharacterized protein n=1 Tax=Platanthera zijinensis TaxID=2320716 RepID=A0AAP0C0D7_9ASPA